MQSDTFGESLEVLGEHNRAELRKVALSFIDNGYQRTHQFQELMHLLAIGNQRETGKVMERLFEDDLEMFRNFLDSGIITNKTILHKLNGLMGENA